MKKNLALLAVLLISACGGGGSSSTSPVVTPPATTVSLDGSWGGTYESTEVVGISLHLENDDATVTGSFVTDSGLQGTVTGTLADNALTGTLTSTATACSGTYTVTGTATDSAIDFTYSGTDCDGTYTNKPGNIKKLPVVGAVASSGNWAGNPGTDHYTLLSINTTDGTSYSGSIRLYNTTDGSELTGTVAGTGTSLAISSIQGKLSATETVPVSGAISVGGLSGGTLTVTGFAFDIGGGLTHVLLGDTFELIP